MWKIFSHGLLLIALATPIASFWWLAGRVHVAAPLAAAAAVALGWALSVAWALASRQAALEAAMGIDGDTLPIALKFGWFCPSVLVAVTWLVFHFTRAAAR